MKICTPSAFRLWSSRCRKSRFSLNASNSRRSFSMPVSSAMPMRLVSPLMTYSSRPSAPLEHLLGHGDRLQHDLVHVCVCLGELAQDLLAHLAQRAPAELLVQKVRGTLELVGRVMALELDDAVLHLAVVSHQYHQHPALRH